MGLWLTGRSNRNISDNLEGVIAIGGKMRNGNLTHLPAAQRELGLYLLNTSNLGIPRVLPVLEWGWVDP